MSFSLEELNKVVETVDRLGSQRKAAKELGITRRSLQRRLYAYNNRFLNEHSNELGFDKDKVTGYWVKSKTGSFYVKNDTPIDYNELREQFIKDSKEYAPKYKKNEKREVNEKHLLVIDIADIHFGKLSLIEETGHNYNLEIAESRMTEGINKLLQKAEGHGIDRIVFILGNDFLHRDNAFNTTTAGTYQDADGMWWQAFNVAKRSYISAIERLAEIAPVHLVFCPSNHDYVSGFMLSDTICSWFSNHPNVITKDGSLSISHRKYIQYGSNLIGFTHGDGAKEHDLSSLMQFEARANWGVTRFGYWYLHHYHIKNRKIYGKTKIVKEVDHVGVTIIETGKQNEPDNSIYVEVVRSPSAADGWHNRNGYIGNAAVECFLHHIDEGQVARFTHYF